MPFQLDHLEQVLGSGKVSGQEAKSVFAIPVVSDTTSAEVEMMVFKLVTLHPERRSYLQRRFSLSQDAP